ncbi:hypothetical protein [Hyphomonas sp.]|uniref:hypothetical protein n=1 Tax=Hyphomonas sp. TaxID=87 RepID=UPI0025BD50AC|nr:hypothetical protein [Hyphomonas sp.]
MAVAYHVTSEGERAGRLADRYARAASAPSPLRNFLNAVEHGDPADVLAELELARARALLGEDTLLDPDMDFLA